MLADLSGTNLNDAFVLNYSPETFTVAVTRSTNGSAPTNLGTFSWIEPINLNGLAGHDSAEIRLGNFFPYDVSITSSAITILNGTGALTRSSIESLKIVGTSQDDTYRFDADGPLGLVTIDESAGDPGTIWGDTLDFSSTSSPINLSLSSAVNQVVNANLTLNLMSGSTFEHAIGGDGDDTIIGNSLNNRLTGNGGNDRLTGFAGSDILDGGAGCDTLLGGEGDDDYIFATAFAAEADELIETVTQTANGSSGDELRFTGVTTPVTLNLGSTSIQNVHTNRTLKLNSASTFESVFGGSGNDFLTGNSQRNHLYGMGGHDILVGGAGNDLLNGGEGRDILIGGVGQDSLYGGADDDILIGGTAASGRTLNLNAVRNKWISTANYQDRINAITSGPLTESLIVLENVYHDTDVDLLYGEHGRDWFFGVLYGSISDEHDRESNEAWEFW